MPALATPPPSVRRLLFLMLSYPDVGRDQNMYTDLVQELVRRGCDVKVLCPAGDGAGVGLHSEGGVAVLRVHTGRLFRVGLVRKGWSNLRLPAQFGRALEPWLREWRAEWVITPTPPITLTPLVRRLKQRWGCRSYLILRDIFPQNAVDLGLLHNGLVLRHLRRLEQQTYATSDLIGCMSPGNRSYLLRGNSQVKARKVRLFSNWISPDDDRLRDKTKAKREVGIDGEFVCLLGGNLGRPQRVDFFVDVAQAVGPDARVRFLVVGDGTERQWLEREVARRHLNHVTLLPWLDRQHYSKILEASDLGVILLHENFTIPNIPSRLLSYWKAGLPVLAAVNSCTDLAESFLQRHGAGLTVAMNDVAGCATAIRALRDDPAACERMGRNGRAATERHYTTRDAASRLLEQLASVESFVSEW